jgi:regulatory protein
MAGRPRARSRETTVEARARRALVEDPAVVLEAAARFLEARPRSVAEVRRRLGDAGYRADLVEGAVERLVGLGYLDDAAFARAWVESRDRARPRGSRALRDELHRKGVPPEVVEAVLAGREADAAGEAEAAAPAAGERATSSASDRDAAERLLARRGGAILREPDPRRRAAKAYALLARNGFDPDVCREAARAWLSGANHAGDADGDAGAEGP